ncbi:MAG: PhnD/SsuA/transferrin family substrate-binding protein [Dongiaceae bacterium]
MRAGLPMYDLPELRAANDAFWAGLAGHLRAEGIAGVPLRLEHPGDYETHWLAPDLLFSQTCGYPLRHRLRNRVRYVATPSYAVEGCGRGTYRSVVLVNEKSSAKSLGDLRGRIAAFNDTQSQSGMNALRAVVAPLNRNGRFFARVIQSGRHEASIRAVATGAADVATVDCVTWACLQRYRPASVGRLRVLGMTQETPALPFIAARTVSAEKIRRMRVALARAIADPALARVREALFLSDIVVLPESAYLAIDRMEEDATALGYPQLA